MIMIGCGFVSAVSDTAGRRYGMSVRAAHTGSFRSFGKYGSHKRSRVRHLHLQPPFPRPHHTCQLRLRININADPDADINMEWIARGNAQALRDAERVSLRFVLAVDPD